MRRTRSCAIAIALMTAGTAVARPVPVAPAATPFRIGSLHLVALRDLSNVVPDDGSVFGVGVPPPQVAAVLTHAGAPADPITLGVDALLVRLPGHVVLIDTGFGAKAGGVLQASLAAAKVAPAQVTDILITHSHPDHVGGLADADGALAFPDATIRMTAAEWTFMQGKAAPALVAAIRPRVVTFAPGAMVLPGIRAIALPGHTPGHSGYEIMSGGDRLIDIGDTAHSAVVSLAKPGWTIAYDTDAAQGRATREAELARLAASHDRIFAPHFPYPGVGFVVADGPAFRFVPALPQ